MKKLFLTLFTLLSINLFSQCENDSINPYFVNFEPEVTISCDVDTIGGDTSISSLALAAGVVIYGNFDDVAVASGKVVCYLR